jgi:hypothetical protein
VSYSWLKNGRQFHLDGGSGHRVFRESPFDGNIIFVSPGQDDVGTYQVFLLGSFETIYNIVLRI